MNVNNQATHRVPSLRESTGHQAIQRVEFRTGHQSNVVQDTMVKVTDEKEKAEVKSTVEKLNDFNDPIHTNLKFVLHDELEKYYVKVVNPQTDEVIREIPPKKMLDMYAAMAEYMGLLVDEKV